MRTFLFRLFFSIGFACIVASGILFIERNNPYRLAFRGSTQIAHTLSDSSRAKPGEITIPSVGISLPIIPAKQIDTVWQTTDQGVSYLVSSPLPGSTGNSILYGHNWMSLLGKLTKVVPGNTIIIGFSDGSQKAFTVTYTAIVSPDQTSILENSQDKRITIYTCTGFLDSKRFVVTAVLGE